VNVIIVDTSSWISYLRGSANSDLDLALKEGRVFLPPIVVAELLSSRMKPSEREPLISLLKELPLCDTPFEHWLKVGEFRSRAAAKGINISTPDAHIAQCVLDLDGYLLSEDAIFKKAAKVSSLRVLDA
jgi:tRNA(fMet)-specific endonuclease VapC